MCAQRTIIDFDCTNKLSFVCMCIEPSTKLHIVCEKCCVRFVLFLIFFFWNNVEPDNHRTIHEINSESNRKSILKKINYLQLLLAVGVSGWFLASWRKVGSSSYCFWFVLWFGKTMVVVSSDKIWFKSHLNIEWLIELIIDDPSIDFSTLYWKLSIRLFGSYFSGNPND